MLRTIGEMSVVKLLGAVPGAALSYELVAALSCTVLYPGFRLIGAAAVPDGGWDSEVDTVDVYERGEAPLIELRGAIGWLVTVLFALFFDA